MNHRNMGLVVFLGLLLNINSESRKHAAISYDPFLSNALQPFKEFDPFQMLDRSLLQPLNQIERANKGVLMDIYERDDGYDVRADLPGFTKDSIDIKIDNNTLTITAEKSESVDVDTDRFHRRERHIGKVRRSILLPQNVNQDDIKATFEHGVLSIKIPKLSVKSQEKKILIT